MDKKYNFNLIELIVVISILLALISLVQPSLNKIIHSADDAICKNKLGEIYQAISLYVDDHDSFLPGPFLQGQTARFGRYDNNYNVRLAGYLYPYLLEQKDKDHYRYVETFFCPSAQKADIHADADRNPIQILNYILPVHRQELDPHIFPFGRVEDRLNGLWDRRESMQINIIEQPHKTFIMEDVDVQNYPYAIGHIPDYPIHHEYRNRNYFDGHVDIEIWVP